jgi:hypothetical protein
VTDLTYLIITVVVIAVLVAIGWMIVLDEQAAHRT